MWIVMTSKAKMPNSCWGTYRNVALVEINQHYTAENRTPAMISERARGVLRVRHLGHFNVGKTGRCAYSKAITSAVAQADELNNAAPAAQGELLSGWASA